MIKFKRTIKETYIHVQKLYSIFPCKKWHVSYVIHLKINDMNGSKMGPLLSERPFFLLLISIHLWKSMMCMNAVKCPIGPLLPDFPFLFVLSTILHALCGRRKEKWVGKWKCKSSFKGNSIWQAGKSGLFELRVFLISILLHCVSIKWFQNYNYFIITAELCFYIVDVAF